MKYTFCWGIGFTCENGRYLLAFETTQEREFASDDDAVQAAQDVCVSLVYTVSEVAGEKVPRLVYTGRVLGPGERDRMEDDLRVVLNLSK